MSMNLTLEVPGQTLEVATAEVAPEATPSGTNNFTRRQKRQFKELLQLALASAMLLGLAPAGAFAQTAPAAPAAFGTAVTNIVNMIKSICGVGIVLLLVAGFGLIMWGGINDSWRRRGLTIIGCGILGGGLLFLFADPLAQFLATTFAAPGAPATRP